MLSLRSLEADSVGPRLSGDRSSLSGPWTARVTRDGRGNGGVRERPNRHDWKSCVGKLTVGSNPTASARRVPTEPGARSIGS
jgi:hypothetical protein